MGASTGVVHAYADAGSSSTSATTGGLEEIIVTAQRRVESIQNVPITIQAIGSEQLSQLSVSTFDDVIKLLPNVTLGANGPGQGNIFMRGLSAGFAGNQSSATVAPMPNVATYLDDQAMSFPARNADVYMADMERVEILEGPQGTLFGGGAEAGAVRYITKKPVLNKEEGSVEASYGVTAHGDPNSSMVGVINLPLSNSVAVRVVGYNDRRGGYIDNVKSDFTRYPSDPGLGFWGAQYPASALGHPSANNSALAGRAQNPTTYQGLRASLLWQINDNWDLLVQQSYQHLDAEGLNEQYPCSSDSVPNSGTTLGTCKPLGPWEATWFSPTYDKDRYSSTAWTLNGKIGDLKAVYTGSYMTRHIEQNMDYTNYARTAYGFYYTCAGDGVDGSGNTVTGSNIGAGTPGVCYSPVSWWTDRVYSKHQSHEFRVTTPDDKRLRALVGAYWEKMEIYDNQNFEYKSIPSCLPAYFDSNNVHLPTAPVCLGNPGPLPGTASTDPNWRDDNAAYGQDVYRHFTQLAFFTSIDFDIIPKVLTVTAGTRHYKYDEGMFGSKWITSTKNENVPNGDPLGTGNLYGKLIDPVGHHSEYSGFKSRANITWHVTPDTMVYYTFSQGFRAGSFNRTPDNKTKIYTIVDASGAVVGAVPTGMPISDVVLAPGQSIISGGSTRQFQVPLTYPPDTLTNNEIGFKSTLFNHRLLLNGSFYSMDWKNVQTLIYSPTIFGNSTFGVTGPDFRVRGLELQFTGRLSEGWTLQGTFSHNSSKQTSSPCVQSVGTIAGAQNPTAAGACITAVKGTVLDANGNPVAGNAEVVNALGSLGDTPAFSPKNQYNLRLRYDWTSGEYKSFAMVGANHTDTMDNTPSSFKAGSTAGFEVPTTTWARFTMPGYTTYDASVGVAKDNWTAELYGANLANNNASQFTTSGQWIRAETPLRPRVLGLKFGLKF
jgi:outer membrane receptor protein involved in Fe transport